MKIGLDTAPAALRGTYFQHLASVLARYAPEHEYIIGAEVNDGVDLYHGFRSSLPLSVHLRRVPSVMTVPNLNFLRYPHLYTFAERLFVLTLYRRALRRAGRVITVSAPAREELSERLNIDPSKIEVMVPLAVPAPRGNPSQAELEHVRRKYALPEYFILMIGTVEPRHNHQAVFAALADAASSAGVVVCGRRTAWSDYLLGYARARRIAARVDFIYELTPSDLPALFRLARVFAYLPDADAEASVVPRGRGPAGGSADGLERHAGQPRSRRRGRRLCASGGAGRGSRGARKRVGRRVVAPHDAGARTPPRRTVLRIRRGGTTDADLHVAVTPAFEPQAAGGSAGTNRLSGHFLRIPNPKLLPKKVLRILAVLKDSSIFVFAK